MEKRDTACDYIRCIAMFAIILCHFFQIRNYYTLFSWLNIGVQVFLVLSARLMCRKEVSTCKQVITFYKTRLLRICLPIWIYLLCLVPVLFVVGRGPDLSAILMYTTGMAGFAKSGILGLGHFWYITVLLLCYLLVPVLYYMDRATHAVYPVVRFAVKAAVVITPILVFGTTPQAYLGVNIALFVFAYFYFRAIGNDPRWSSRLTLQAIPFVILAIGVRLYLDSLISPNTQLYELGTTASKATIGFFLFALLHLMFSRLGSSRAFQRVRLISRISYEVYIVHQFILLAFYEYVPFFRSGHPLSGLALLAAASSVIIGNAAILHIANNKIINMIMQFTERIR